MRKGFKKLAAVALTAGMLVSSITSGVIAQEETKETSGIKKGTVITDFKEVKDVKDLVPGTQYFFSSKKFGVEDAVAALPSGSAILQFAGTDVEEAVEAGTFEINPAYFESYESYVQYQYDQLVMYFPLTEDAVYEFLENMMGIKFTSWDEVLEMQPEMAEECPTVDDFIASSKVAFEEELVSFNENYPSDVSAFLEETSFATWDEYAENEKEKINNQIQYLPEYFSSSSIQQEQDGYVSAIQRGAGFDECDFGTIAYLVEETETMKEQAGYWNATFDGAGWYYGCCGSAVGYVGPFYLYSYKVNEFTEDDLIITFADGWKEPTTASTVKKSDVILSVIIDGEEVFIPFYDLLDSKVDPTNDDTTIKIKVGEIEKVLQVCNIKAGEVDKDVQISEGAPTVGLENAVESLMEAVLTETELKLVASGVDVDIYMTVVGKEVEELGEDKAVLEEAMEEGDKAVYLDLKLFKKVGNNEPTAISEVPGGKIKVSIEVPDSIKQFAAKAKVVRVHGTEVTVLTTTYDAATNKLTFETDRFSTYAIVYNEADVDTDPTPDPTPDLTPDPIPDPTPAPDSGDSAMVGLYMAIIVLAGAAVFMRKKVASM